MLCGSPWRVLERLPGLDLAGGEVEPMDAGKAVVLRPDLAVDVRALRAHHVDLRGVDVLLRAATARYLNFSRLAVELDDAWPGTCCRATDCRPGRRAAPRMPVGKPGLCSGTGILGDLAGLGIEPAEVLLAEVRVPGDAVLIDDHVVRLDGLARQVVFGDDHAGGAAARTRQRLERIVPLRLRAQIDAC